MPGAARSWRCIRHLLVMVCLVVVPALDTLDGDVAKVEVRAAETGVALAEEPVRLADGPREPGASVSARLRLSLPTGLPVPWRPSRRPLIRCRCVLRPCARASDADADPA